VLCNRVSIVRFALPSLLILAIAVGANPARSQEYNWNGFSVYAGIGVSKMDADVSISDETTYSVRDGPANLHSTLSGFSA
jgi:hypothetical protein